MSRYRRNNGLTISSMAPGSSNSPATWSTGITRGLSLGLIAVGVVLAFFGWRSSASAATQGTATLQGDNNTVLTSGTLSTPFLIGLSAPGVCSGTSSTQPNYFVFGFIVAVPSASSSLAAELAAVDWTGGAGSSYYPLYSDSAGTQYGPANTSTTGQPMPPPGGNSFQFQYTQTALTTNNVTPTLPGHSWEVGLACETGNKAVDYWATQVTFDASGNWTVASGTTSGGSTTTSTTTSGTGSTTTTTPSGTTTGSGDTTTTTASDTTTSVPGDTTTVPSTGSGSSGATGGGGTPSPATGSSQQLPLTGAPVRTELNIAIGLIGSGALLYVLVTPMPRRRSRRFAAR